MVSPRRSPRNRKRSVSPARRGSKFGDDVRGGGGHLDNDKVMSPLSNQPHLWDSPSPSSSITKSSTPSSQRKLLFGFGSTENIENKGMCKKKCKKGGGGKATTAPTTVAFSDIFSKSSPTIGGASRNKSLLLGPRLTCRQSKTAFLPVEDTLAAEEKDLALPKSPPKKKSPKPPKLKLSPRKADSMSVSNTMSPLHPPQNLIRAASNDLDFTLTPTVLYDDFGSNKKGHYYNHRLMGGAPMSASGSQHYHQSPHWSGQVRVNPFSPVPEQYLRPPTSTKSVPNKGRNHGHPGFYNLINLEPPKIPGTDGGPDELGLVPRKKKSRLNPIHHLTRGAASAVMPRLDDFDDNGDLYSEISPTDVTNKNDLFGTKTIVAASGKNKRKAQDVLMKPPPQSMMDTNAGSWQDHNKRMRIKRGRYLDDFQEVQFLGAGSFGSVNACLSRLDGCQYAVKSISPSGQIRKGNDTTGMDEVFGGGADYLYGGRKMMSNQCSALPPPTPRRDLVPSPLRRKKTMSRLGLGLLSSNAHESELMADDDCYDLGVLEGSSHWNDGALRRMLREVFALAALCQQDDFRTFHIVRYQQAWLEDDGTLYIQTELCSATLRDEMSRKGILAGSGATNNGSAIIHNNTSHGKQKTTTTTTDVFRQIKVLREVLLGLELVHQQGMVHLDIKPENIFVKNDLYKLGDFGLAYRVFTKNNGGKAAAAAAATPDVEEGDSRYMSKDLLDFSPRDLTKCDIFSLGATMYEVCSGRPLPTCGQEWQDLRNGKLPPLPGTMPCIIAIIREMMHPDPEKRPSATDLLSRDALGSEDENPLLGMLSQKTTSSAYKMGPTQKKKMNLTRPSLKRSASI